jgi:hypothetical protein
MAGAAVDLVVRFAGTMLLAKRVRAHERFLIGTARDVDFALAFATLTSFPLVDTGLVVRVPIGVEPTFHDATRTELPFGLVTISITRVSGAPVVVPRPPASRRILPFAAIALVLHVALVAVAMATATVEPITIPVVRAEAPRVVPAKLLPTPKPPPPKQKKQRRASAPEAAAAPSEAPPAAGTPQQAAEAARSAGFLGSASLDDLSAIVGTKDLAAELADVGPVYDEREANAGNFGNSAGNFNPQNDPKFDSVRTGPVAITGNMGQSYRLPAHGKFREVERPPIMGLTCDDGQCTTVGVLDRFTVRDYVEKRYVDMAKCFERHSRKAPRIELVLHFDIDSDGTANEVYSEEGGAFGSCLVRIVERTKFPKEKPTQVKYTVAFWRT